MIEDFEKRLETRWPRIFAWFSLDPEREKRSFGHEAGWSGILDALGETLTDVATARGPHANVHARPTGKQHGAMQLHLISGDDDVRRVAQLARAMALRVCEVTGLPGRLGERDGQFQVLSPGLMDLRGFTPVRRFANPNIPALDLDKLSVSLRDRWPDVLVGPVEIPPGLADLVDVMVEHLHDQVASVHRVGFVNDRLTVEIVDPDSVSRALVAYSVALSARIDPSSGCHKGSSR